eukprot:11213244-Lingulodinium_polyedra.AAC.1
MRFLNWDLLESLLKVEAAASKGDATLCVELTAQVTNQLAAVVQDRTDLRALLELQPRLAQTCNLTRSPHVNLFMGGRAIVVAVGREIVNQP